MSSIARESGFASIHSARIYYEVAGAGRPFVMLHAGVADSRQWEAEFTYYASRFRVIRYDLRGYGRSEPVAGEFSHLGDLIALLAHLRVDQPAILMGCSMGGALALDYALERPAGAAAIILVGSAVTGLKLDVPEPRQVAEAEQAYDAGDLDRVAELYTQIWFDGAGREPDQVNPRMRRLVCEMISTALTHEARHLGKRLPNTEVPAAGRCSELKIPVQIIAGVHDTAYILAAADYLVEKIPHARKVLMADAAHLPNLDHPDRFRDILAEFLDSLRDRLAGRAEGDRA